MSATGKPVLCARNYPSVTPVQSLDRPAGKLLARRNENYTDRSADTKKVTEAALRPELSKRNPRITFATSVTQALRAPFGPSPFLQAVDDLLGCVIFRVPGSAL